MLWAQRLEEGTSPDCEDRVQKKTEDGGVAEELYYGESFPVELVDDGSCEDQSRLEHNECSDVADEPNVFFRDSLYTG